MNISELWRKQPKLMVIAAAVTVALGSSAQQPQQPTRENANRPQTEQQVARSEGATQTLEQYLQAKTVRVSKLAGMELQTRSGDNVGEVVDVLRGAAPGQDMQLVVEIGGSGGEAKMVAVPFDEVQINGDGDELYANSTREQLASAPAVQLDRGQTATLAQRDANDANRDAAERGQAQPGAGQARGPQGAAPGGGGQRGTGSATVNDRRVGDLIGAEVLGTGDEEVGSVDDIVISTAGADSVRAVLSIGGIAGVGAKHVSLPLGQLNVDRSGDEPTLRVMMDREALERLPEFKYEEQTQAL
jgi:sporulation protein YlmC with PRC-barrel domain